MSPAEFEAQARMHVAAMDRQKKIYLWKLMQTAQRLYWEDIRSLAAWAENMEKK
jgi:hypothetical protein